jgi:hypothetical protein
MAQARPDAAIAHEINQCILKGSWAKVRPSQFEVDVVSHQPRKGKIKAQRQARRLWLAGTALMAAAPLKFAVAALLNPAPLDPAVAQNVGSAILMPPAWLTQILGPIDQALRTSGPSVLPALVVLVLLLRLWVNYGRELFKPLPLARR